MPTMTSLAFLFLVGLAVVGQVAVKARAMDVINKLAWRQNRTPPTPGTRLVNSRSYVVKNHVPHLRTEDSSATYLNYFRFYNSTTCSGSSAFLEVFHLETCTPISSASNSASYFAFSYDHAWNSLFQFFYSDSSCTALLSTYNVISEFSAADGVCECDPYSTHESQYYTFTSVPATTPSVDGTSVTVYSSTSTCARESEPILARWTAASVTGFDDDDVGWGDDYVEVGDDKTQTCKAHTATTSNLTVTYTMTFEETVVVIPSSSSSSSSSSSKKCFAASETVQFESGSTVSISEVKVGDRVLAADRFGNPEYSSVIAVPHDNNNKERATFTQLITASGANLKLTPDHIVAASKTCSASDNVLVTARQVTEGMCLQTAAGFERVTEIKESRGVGVHTIVTEAEMVIVNGFVASPFADNHAVAHAFYNIVRFVNRLEPGVASLSVAGMMKTAIGMFGDMAASVSL